MPFSAAPATSAGPVSRFGMRRVLTSAAMHTPMKATAVAAMGKGIAVARRNKGGALHPPFPAPPKARNLLSCEASARGGVRRRRNHVLRLRPERANVLGDDDGRCSRDDTDHCQGDAVLREVLCSVVSH